MAVKNIPSEKSPKQSQAGQAFANGKVVTIPRYTGAASSSSLSFGPNGRIVDSSTLPRYTGTAGATGTEPIDSGSGPVGGSPLDGITAAAPSPISDDEAWLSGDSAYQTQLAALQRALSDSQADFSSQRTKYNTDFADALKQLGWKQDIQDDPTTPDVNEAQPGAWNFQDLNTAAGRSFNNQQNDFASRGLIQSSLYGTAQDNLTRSLNDQLASINTGRQTFLDDLARQESSTKNENTLSQQQARAEALARRAAGLGIV